MHRCCSASQRPLSLHKSLTPIFTHDFQSVKTAKVSCHEHLSTYSNWKHTRCQMTDVRSWIIEWLPAKSIMLATLRARSDRRERMLEHSGDGLPSTLKFCGMKVVWFSWMGSHVQNFRLLMKMAVKRPRDTANHCSTFALFCNDLRMYVCPQTQSLYQKD
jgi:hypothetical protein